MNEKVCLIYLFEDKGRASMNSLLIDGNGELTNRNNWTFDILSFNLFDSILKQIIQNNGSIGQYLIGLPGFVLDGKFKTADFFEIDQDYFDDMAKANAIEIKLVNDVDVMIQGFSINHNQDKSSEMIAGLYLPSSFPPGVSAINVNGNDRELMGFAGEIHHVFPEIKWDTLLEQKSKLKLQVLEKLIWILNSMVMPSRMVVYSELFKEEDIVKVFESMDSSASLNLKGISFEKTVRDDFEAGMAYIGADYLKEAYCEN